MTPLEVEYDELHTINGTDLYNFDGPLRLVSKTETFTDRKIVHTRALVAHSDSLNDFADGDDFIRERVWKKSALFFATDILDIQGQRCCFDGKPSIICLEGQHGYGVHWVNNRQGLDGISTLYTNFVNTTMMCHNSKNPTESFTVSTPDFIKAKFPNLHELTHEDWTMLFLMR